MLVPVFVSWLDFPKSPKAYYKAVALHAPQHLRRSHTPRRSTYIARLAHTAALTPLAYDALQSTQHFHRSRTPRHSMYIAAKPPQIPWCWNRRLQNHRKCRGTGIFGGCETTANTVVLEFGGCGTTANTVVLGIGACQTTVKPW